CPALVAAGTECSPTFAGPAGRLHIDCNMFSCVAATPLGRPVVPEVKMIWASSWALTVTFSGAFAPLSSSARDLAQPAHPAIGWSLTTPSAAALACAHLTCSSP